MKKIIMWVLIAVFVVLCTIFIYNSCSKKESDAVKFSKEYTSVSEDNVFVYKDITEIITLLQKGTGAVYLGFPDCVWCNAYVEFINEAAKEKGITEVYYYNIKEDRNNNTDNYKKLVSILGDNLLPDNENNKRIYVPDFTVVKNGKIIAHNNETSVIEEYDSPKDYWTDERKENILITLKDMLGEISTVCTDCN